MPAKVLLRVMVQVEVAVEAISGPVSLCKYSLISVSIGFGCGGNVWNSALAVARVGVAERDYFGTTPVT